MPGRRTGAKATRVSLKLNGFLPRNYDHRAQMWVSDETIIFGGEHKERMALTCLGEGLEPRQPILFLRQHVLQQRHARIIRAFENV